MYQNEVSKHTGIKMLFPKVFWDAASHIAGGGWGTQSYSQKGKVIDDGLQRGASGEDKWKQSIPREP